MTRTTTQTLPEKVITRGTTRTTEAIDPDELYSRLLRLELIRSYCQIPEEIEPSSSILSMYTNVSASGTDWTVSTDIFTRNILYIPLSTFFSGQAYLATENIWPIPGLSWEVNSGYPITYPQPLALVSGLLGQSGWPMVSGVQLNMPVVSALQEKEGERDEQILSLLDRVYTLAASGRTRPAAAKIMEYTDNLLLGGQFEICRRLLGRIDASRLSKYPTLLVAFLGITLGAKEKLSEARKRFYASAQAEISRELGPDRAERILRRFQ